MLIKSSLAAVLFESHKPLELVEINFPSTLEPGQVLVELIMSGICGAQINEIDAAKGPDKFLPHLLGHEGLAIVLETGPGVAKVRPGDTVIMHWRPSAGIVAPTPKYKYGKQTVNAGWVTTFNKNAIVSENRLTKIHKSNLDQRLLPLLGCALTTALGVLENDARLSIRDDLLIVGFGGVGVCLALFAKFMRVRRIVVVDIDNSKKHLAEKIGVDLFIHSTGKDSTLASLEEYYGNKRPTVAIDTSGKSSSIELCYEISHEQGRTILVGVPTLSDNSTIYTLPLHFGKVLTGSKGGDSVPDIDIPFIVELLEKNELGIQDFPVNVVPFNEINSGIEMIRAGVNGRVVIDFSANS